MRFDNITFAYGDKQVFSDFSLTISDGARIALMGASGSGKTTLLMLAAGLLQPQRGSLTTDANGAAFLFQENRLVPSLTAVRNILLVAPGADAVGLLTELGLGSEADEYPDELSGGMARRVALARALAYSASGLLLLDEPFSGLDDAARIETAACVLRHAAARTLIIATHDVEEARLLNAEIVRI